MARAPLYAALPVARLAAPLRPRGPAPAAALRRRSVDGLRSASDLRGRGAGGRGGRAARARATRRGAALARAPAGRARPGLRCQARPAPRDERRRGSARVRLRADVRLVARPWRLPL